jgi:hypothetical protein
MAIKTDAQALEAKYGGKSGQATPPAMQEFYYPGSGNPPPGSSGPHQIPQGKPVEPGQFVSQVVGRGEPIKQMAVVPPQAHQPNQPQMAVMPPQPTNRTSLGTMVEPQQMAVPQMVIRTNTNPMDAATPEPPKQQVEQPAPKPERKLDLAKEICDHIWEMGGEKSDQAQKFYERSSTTLKNWMANPATIPLGAVLKFMHRTPGIKEAILEELEPHFEANGHDNWVTSAPNRTKTNVMICSAVLDRPTLPFTTVLGYLTKKYELGFTFQADTMIHRSRNMLAKRFLDSGCLWSLWIDADVAPPIANPDWYRWITNCTTVPQEYCSYDVLARLLGQSKAVIGGVYASRRWHGALVVQPEINPRSHEDKLLCNEIRRGTARGLAEVDWIGFGCALVHREVFLEVQRNFPQLAPQTEQAPWRYFHPEGDEGEDEAFCRRVRACGIPIWLDTQLICGHIGSMAFLPEHTNPVLAL